MQFDTYLTFEKINGSLSIRSQLKHLSERISNSNMNLFFHSILTNEMRNSRFTFNTSELKKKISSSKSGRQYRMEKKTIIATSSSMIIGEFIC